MRARLLACYRIEVRWRRIQHDILWSNRKYYRVCETECYQRSSTIREIGIAWENAVVWKMQAVNLQNPCVRERGSGRPPGTRHVVCATPCSTQWSTGTSLELWAILRGALARLWKTCGKLVENTLSTVDNLWINCEIAPLGSETTVTMFSDCWLTLVVKSISLIQSL